MTLGSRPDQNRRGDVALKLLLFVDLNSAVEGGDSKSVLPSRVNI